MSIQNRDLLSCYAANMPEARCPFLIEMDRKEYDTLVEETGHPEHSPSLATIAPPTILGGGFGMAVAGMAGIVFGGPPGIIFGIGALAGGGATYLYTSSTKLNPWDYRTGGMLHGPNRPVRLLQKIEQIRQRLITTNDQTETQQLNFAKTHFEKVKHRADQDVREQQRQFLQAELARQQHRQTYGY